MSSTVKDLKVSYTPANNEGNTFTSGDPVSGQVELEVAKECEVQSLSIKFKGKAEVLWTERHGQTTVVYHSKNKYFSIKHHFIKDKDSKEGDSDRLLTGDTVQTYSRVLPPGRHIFPFTFQFPMSHTPSSFHADTGKVVYLFEAKLSRSMRIPKKDTTKLNYVTQDTLDNNPELREPQHESKDKKLKLLNSGTVSMDVNLEKVGFYQGESIKVFAAIQNNSSREIRPKFCVYNKQSFFARGKRRLHTKDLVKEVGAPIPPSSSQKVTQLINIPLDMEPSIHNCDILKVEHRLRVYLDVKYASDPEIKFPIVILRAHQFSASGPPPAASDFGFGAYGNANPPVYRPTPFAPQPGPNDLLPQPGAMAQPPALPVNPSDPPPPYTAYGMYPSLPQYDSKPQQHLEVSKKIKVQALLFRAQGQARVCWHEQYGEDVHVVYTSKDKYYDVEHYILRETRQDGTEIIGPGRHVFPFSFKIPDRNIPSTFKSSVGKIVHKLKAELKQSMRVTKTAKTHFTFVSQADMDIPGLLEPQYGCKDKKISAFGSGTVALDIRTERLGYWQGEAVKVTAEIKNQSSRAVKPKFVLYKKKSHFAQGKRRMNTSEILKEKCDPVESGCNKTVTKTITIPKELAPSILNCSIIRLEYRIKVLLDIKCASNPEIKLPIIVLPEQSNHTAMDKQSAKLKQCEASAQPSPHSVYYPPVQAFAEPLQSAAEPQAAAAATESDDPPPYGALYPSYHHTDQHRSQF